MSPSEKLNIRAKGTRLKITGGGEEKESRGRGAHRQLAGWSYQRISQKKGEEDGLKRTALRRQDAKNADLGTNAGHGRHIAEEMRGGA